MMLTVAQTHPACTVLGPGSRYVIWVQGCGIGCAGCVSPQWIPFAGGRAEPVDALAERVATEAADGLTLSGGEPFAQAEAVARLVETVRARRDLSVMSYSGYRFEHLHRHGTPAQRRLLGLLDLLVDGPYLPAQQAALRWRGSRNQRLHVLSPRHHDLAGAPDVSAGLQFELAADDTLRWFGVPTEPGFRERFEQALNLVTVKEHAA